jgi:hypothetical protein
MVYGSDPVSLFAVLVTLLTSPVHCPSYPDSAKGQDNSVGIATGYGLDGQVTVPLRNTASRPDSGAQPVSYPMGTDGPFPEVKEGEA